jgi:CRP/FNR family transcriptional regulator, cyclic AMP receptor protein
VPDASLNWQRTTFRVSRDDITRPAPSRIPFQRDRLRVILAPMPSDPKLEMLHRIPLFERFGKAELERLGQLADAVDVPDGNVLMREGDLGSQMFIVASGRVRIDRDGENVTELGPGDWFGEMALLSEGRRSATATATEPSRLLVLAHREFHALMDENPAVRSAVFDCVADRLRQLETGSAH